jgi:hypothetical protein
VVSGVSTHHGGLTVTPGHHALGLTDICAPQPSDDFLQCFQQPRKSVFVFPLLPLIRRADREKDVKLNRENLVCFTSRGLRTASGQELDFDLIACATGFDIQFVPHL